VGAQLGGPLVGRRLIGAVPLPRATSRSAPTRPSDPPPRPHVSSMCGYPGIGLTDMSVINRSDRGVVMDGNGGAGGGAGAVGDRLLGRPRDDEAHLAPLPGTRNTRGLPENSRKPRGGLSYTICAKAALRSQLTRAKFIAGH